MSDLDRYKEEEDLFFAQYEKEAELAALRQDKQAYLAILKSMGIGEEKFDKARRAMCRLGIKAGYSKEKAEAFADSAMQAMVIRPGLAKDPK